MQFSSLFLTAFAALAAAAPAPAPVAEVKTEIAARDYHEVRNADFSRDGRDGFSGRGFDRDRNTEIIIIIILIDFRGGRHEHRIHQGDHYDQFDETLFVAVEVQGGSCNFNYDGGSGNWDSGSHSLGSNRGGYRFSSINC
jgi:hypothetical protein